MWTSPPLSKYKIRKIETSTMHRTRQRRIKKAVSYAECVRVLCTYSCHTPLRIRRVLVFQLEPTGNSSINVIATLLVVYHHLCWCLERNDWVVKYGLRKITASTVSCDTQGFQIAQCWEVQKSKALVRYSGGWPEEQSCDRNTVFLTTYDDAATPPYLFFPLTNASFIAFRAS